MDNAPLSDDARRVVRPKSQKARLRKLFPEVISEVANGKTLRSALHSRQIDWETFYRHLRQSPEARESYARARQDCVEKWVDEIVEMSDAVIGQPQEIVTATRNAVDARKWVASKLVPRVYGDQPTGITINNKTNVMVISEEQQRELQETRRRLLEARGDTA